MDPLENDKMPIPTPALRVNLKQQPQEGYTALKESDQENREQGNLGSEYESNQGRLQPPSLPAKPFSAKYRARSRDGDEGGASNDIQIAPKSDVTPTALAVEQWRMRRKSLLPPLNLAPAAPGPMDTESVRAGSVASVSTTVATTTFYNPKKFFPTGIPFNLRSKPTAEELLSLGDDTFFLPKYLIEKLRHKFDLLDTDKSGTIESKEVAQLLEELGFNPTEEEVQELVAAVDLNKNGLIDFYEFLFMFVIKMLGQEEKTDDLWEVFDLLDTEVDDIIEMHELKSNVDNLLGEELSDEELRFLVQYAESCGRDQGFSFDGVTWPHFCTAVTSIDPKFEKQKKKKSTKSSKNM